MDRTPWLARTRLTLRPVTGRRSGHRSGSAGRLLAAALLVGLVMGALPGALPGAGGDPQVAWAAESISVTLKTGATLEGRIVEDAGQTFVLQTGAGQFPVEWDALDAESWLVAKRTLLDPADGPGHLELARFAVENGRRDDAEKLLARARRLDEGLAAQADELEPALTKMRLAEAAEFVERAKKHLEAEEHLHALGRFKDALALDEGNADATNGIGEAYYYRRDLKNSRIWVEKALVLDPKHKDALINRAYLRLFLLDFEGCLKGLDEVLALPVAEGRFADRKEALGAAKEAGVENVAEALEKFADMPMMQAKAMRPIMAGIVAGPGFKTEYRTVTEHYDLRTSVSQEYADLVASRLEVMYAEYERLFAGKGERKTRGLDENGKSLKFRVLVFDGKKEYVDWFTRVLQNPQMGRMSGGVYVSNVKHLVFFKYPKMEDTQLVAWHEGMHQYLDYYIAGAPYWFNEGQGDYFGASTLRKSGKRVDMGATNRWRVPVIKQLLRRDRLPPAEYLMQLGGREFMRPPGKKDKGETSDGSRTHVGENYACAWALVHFCLHGQRGRWKKKMTAYFRALADGTEHAEIFRKVWSKTKWESFNAAFKRHCEWLVARADAEAKGVEPPKMPTK